MSGLLEFRRSVSLVLFVLFVLTLPGLTVSNTVYGQQATRRGFVYHSVEDEQGKDLYAMYIPAGVSLNQELPVVVYLHGAGERGTDPRYPLSIGLGPFLKSSTQFLTVFPQCNDPGGRALLGWDPAGPNGKRVIKILEDVRQRYKTDQSKTVLTGWSMGGFGVWSIAAAHPELWSALVPISGGGSPELAAKVKEIPTWVFHGEKDGLVPADRSQQMVDALRKAEGNVIYTPIQDGTHDVWTDVYGSPEVLSWILNPETDEAAQQRAANVKLGVNKAKYGRYGLQPFKPALDLEQAAFVRVGNEFLSSVSADIKNRIRPGMLSGGIRNISMGQTVQGRQFTVTFARNSYNANLDWATIQATGNGRLRVQMALSNININIGGTSISGQRHFASTGPITIRVGHRGAVVLSLDLVPSISDRKVRLRSTGTSFNIPANNFSVSTPQVTRTQGVGMTADRVRSGIVSGLNGSRGRIESEIQAVIPSVIAELERQLDFDDYGDYISSFWPLPAYAPRVKIWPEEIAVDKEGVSLVLGLTAASPVAFGPTPKLQTRNVNGLAVKEIPKTSGLTVGVSSGFVEPLTGLLANTGLAHVNVLDIPDPEFHQLVDRDFMKSLFPGQIAAGNKEVRAEVVLIAPIQATTERTDRVSETGSLKPVPVSFLASQNPITIDVGENSGIESGTQLGLMANNIRILYSSQSDDGKDWTTIGHFDLQMRQNIGLSMRGLVAGKRTIQTDWLNDPELQVTAVMDGVEESELQRMSGEFKSRFMAAWNHWTQGQSSSVNVPDLDLGVTKYRMNSLRSQGRSVAATFAKPATRITNSSSKTLTYKITLPSRRTTTHVLEPGKTHVFNVSSSFTYESTADDGNTSRFLLKSGSHSEFRLPKSGGEPQLFQAE